MIRRVPSRGHRRSPRTDTTLVSHAGQYMSVDTLASGDACSIAGTADIRAPPEQISCRVHPRGNRIGAYRMAADHANTPQRASALDVRVLNHRPRPSNSSETRPDTSTSCRSSSRCRYHRSTEHLAGRRYRRRTRRHTWTHRSSRPENSTPDMRKHLRSRRCRSQRCRNRRHPICTRPRRNARRTHSRCRSARRRRTCPSCTRRDTSRRVGSSSPPKSARP